MKAPRPIIWQIIGGSNKSEDTRRIDPRLIAKGWRAWAEDDVLPHLDRYPGLVGFSGHNPFGTNGNEVMDFDQFLEAEDDLLCRPKCSLEDWQEAWRSIVAAAAPDSAIAYVGTPYGDEDMAGVLNDPGAWLQRWTDSLRPLLDVKGLRIALDHCGRIPADHPLVAAMATLDALGVPPMIEPAPLAELPHLHSRDIWIVDDFWTKGIVAWVERGSPWGAADPAQLTGTIHRFARWNDETKEQTRDRIRKIVDDGHRPIFRPHHLDWYMDTFEIS